MSTKVIVRSQYNKKKSDPVSELTNEILKKYKTNESVHLYTMDKCRQIAESYNGKFIANNILTDTEKTVFKCKYNHIFHEVPSDLLKRDWFCPICEDDPCKGHITNDMLKFSLETIFNRIYGCKYQTEYLAFFTDPIDKCGFFLINHKFYNRRIPYTITSLKLDYKSYKLYEIETNISKGDLMEYIILRHKPMSYKYIDYYTDQLYLHFKSGDSFNIRQFVYTFITNILYKGYKIDYCKSMRFIRELSFGWKIIPKMMYQHIKEIEKIPVTGNNNSINQISCLSIKSDYPKEKILELIVKSITKMGDGKKPYTGPMDKFLEESYKELEKLIG